MDNLILHSYKTWGLTTIGTSIVYSLTSVCITCVRTAGPKGSN